MNRLSGIIIIIFTIGISLLGFFGAAKLIMPTDSDLISGVLSFIGSLIGGYITFLGVKYTLEHGENQKKLDSMSTGMFVLEDCIQELKAPINSFFFLEGTINIDESQRLESYKRILTKFSETLESHYPALKKELDYDFLRILDFHRKSMSNRVFLINNSAKLKETEIPESVEKAREIFAFLLKQSEILLEEYYRIKNRQKRILE